MTLSSQQRSFLLNEQILAAFVLNFGFNALDAWLAFRRFTPIPMWTLPGVALDLVGVVSGLPFLLCLITTPLVKRAVRKQKVGALPHPPSAYPLLRMLPATNLKRSFWLGIVAMVLLCPPLLLAFYLLGVDQLPVNTYIWLKGILCGLLAAVVAPVAALYAMAQAGLEAAPPEVARGQTDALEPTHG